MSGINAKIKADLASFQDVEYKEFQQKLVPTVSKEKFIGVRIPILKKYAKDIAKSPDINEFLEELPHDTYDENNIHAFLIQYEKNFDKCISLLEDFLPYVDNWATCDSLKPVSFAKNKDKLIGKIKDWISSDKTYTIRFGIDMLMTHFLDGDYKNEYPLLVSKIVSDEYYVNMMCAWYFATALAKQYDSVIVYFEKRLLTDTVHKMAIRKACESFRITDDQKAYLKKLR